MLLVQGGLSLSHRALLLASAPQGKENAAGLMHRRERLLPLLPSHKGFVILQVCGSFCS